MLDLKVLRLLVSRQETQRTDIQKQISELKKEFELLNNTIAICICESIESELVSLGNAMWDQIES